MSSESEGHDLDIVERIHRAIGTSSAGDFEHLALDAFAYQYERVEPFRRLCDARGRSPDRVEQWQQIPPVPTSAFKQLRLAAAPEREVFRSSGTTAGTARRSVHYQPFPQLYRAAIDASYPTFCLPEGRPLPTLSLVPARAVVPDSSLGFMAEHVLRRWSGEPAAVALGAGGIDRPTLRDWRRRLGERPAMVFATALALLELTELLEAQDESLGLAAGSVAFETGGFKTLRRSVERGDLLVRLERRLGVPPRRVVREYGMTELSSQAYTRVLAGGDPDLFVTPPWMRFVLLDPMRLEPVPAGERGLLALFDLANVGSALYVLTEDLGRAEGDGFRLLGRARDAELRGCSLTVDELIEAER